MDQTFLFSEIHEQPRVLKTLLQHEQQNIRALAHDIKNREIRHVAIAARGTSDNAGRYAKYLLGAMNQLTVSLATPSLFTIYEQPPLFHHTLVLGISQSGQSPDIISVLTEARRQGTLTAVITNTISSPLAQQADHVINIHANAERSVAATKSYTSQLMAIALLSATLAGEAKMIDALERIPHEIATTLQLNERIRTNTANDNLLITGRNAAQVAQRFRYMRECVVIGRGFNYATAFELALKLKELTYTLVEPYSSADFLHGPLALVESGFPVIVIAPSGKMLPQLQSFIAELQRHQAEILVISDDQSTLDQAHVPLPLPGGIPEWLSPMIAIVPGQLLAMYLAYARHYDPDQPRSLQKVTETK
ncbi:SIS domain-containing protein [Chloroflexi bacterium TSY]|nr:SIS domain-containing protein [Chloroflexi bacterium TSY]